MQKLYLAVKVANIHLIFRLSDVTKMGGVTSVPQLIGNLVTRLFYSLIGANYNSKSISAARGDSPLEKWRGRDYHVYHRFG